MARAKVDAEDQTAVSGISVALCGVTQDRRVEERARLGVLRVRD